MSELTLARDRRLWESWRSGDRAAGSELLQHYEQALYALLHRLGASSSDIDDFYGELVVLLSQYKEKQDLQASFFGLARKMALSLVLRRRQDREQLVAPEDLAESAVDPGPDNSSERLSFQEVLQRCLGRLKHPLERDLFLERFLGGADNHTLAERYQKTANHIAVLVHNAVRHMRGCLERAGLAP